MKRLLTSKYKLAILSLLLTPLVSMPVLAHPGHLSNDAVHGFLHVEHIVALLAIGMAVYLVKSFRGK
jgi:hydrogenase/urease accessory protein HupE